MILLIKPSHNSRLNGETVFTHRLSTNSKDGEGLWETQNQASYLWYIGRRTLGLWSQVSTLIVLHLVWRVPCGKMAGQARAWSIRWGYYSESTQGKSHPFLSIAHMAESRKVPRNDPQLGRLDAIPRVVDDVKDNCHQAWGDDSQRCYSMGIGFSLCGCSHCWCSHGNQRAHEWKLGQFWVVIGSIWPECNWGCSSKESQDRNVWNDGWLRRGISIVLTKCMVITSSWSTTFPPNASVPVELDLTSHSQLASINVQSSCITCMYSIHTIFKWWCKVGTITRATQSDNSTARRVLRIGLVQRYTEPTMSVFISKWLGYQLDAHFPSTPPNIFVRLPYSFSTVVCQLTWILTLRWAVSLAG